VSLLFGRPAREQRALQFLNPPIPPNSQADDHAYGSTRAVPGKMEWSLQKAAVWSVVNLTATIAEIMPMQVFQGDGPTRTEIAAPQWLQDLGGDGHGTPDWLYQAVFSWMLRGNLYGTIGSRDRRMGTPTLIVLAHPDDVSVYTPRSGPEVWRIAGSEMPKAEIFHRRVYSAPGRLLGMSPIEHQALTIGIGISALRFGSQWFHDGAHPSGILKNGESDLKKDGVDQSRAIKDRFMSAMRGRREPLVLGKGWEFQAIQVKPNESQFLETNNFTSAECCRIFGPGYAEVFGYDTGGSLTYSNVEQRSLDLLTYAADPWLVRLERMLSSLLPRPQEVKFNRAALLRTDLLTRFRAHAIGIGARFLLPDEARAVEDMPPLTDEEKTELQAIGVAPPARDNPHQDPAPTEG
jgi:HK97 family phage portal protein